MAGGFDAVHHAAAQAWPTDHPQQRDAATEQGIPFDTTMQSNIMGLYYLLQACLQADVGIFCMTGSNCALGHGYRISDGPFPFQYLPVDEEHPSAVEDSYSYSKLAGELLLQSYASAYGIQAYALRSAGICSEERRSRMAENAKPASGWNPWLWAWVGSEDVASAHRLLMEKAGKGQLPAYGTFFCNADDTSAIELSQELIERFAPELLPLIHDLDGHASLLSNQKLCDAVGWQHRTSWR
jgi:nucleoside-diphosphate-sugar epimerase